jgi:hypothetical protein
MALSMIRVTYVTLNKIIRLVLPHEGNTLSEGRRQGREGRGIGEGDNKTRQTKIDVRIYIRSKDL